MKDTVRRPTVFTESRLHRGPDGRITSASAALHGWEWTRGLANLPDIQLAARVERTEVERQGDVHGTVIPLPHYLGLKQLLRTAPRLVYEIGRTVRAASLVIVRLPGPIGLIAATFARALRRPLAVDLAGDGGEVWRSLYTRPPLHSLHRIVEWATRSTVGAASAVRYVTRRTLQEKYPPKPGATTVGYSAVRLPEDWLRDAPSPGSAQRPTILAIGTHEQMYKGHDTLIRAFASVKRQITDAELILIGGGRCQHSLKVLAANLGLSANVHFRGHVTDRASIREEIDQSWVFAQPSRTEGLPRALVEAMARGKSAAGTSAGGIPELISDRCIVPVDDHDALATLLITLLRDRSLREELGLENLRTAATYTAESLAQSERVWQVSVAALLDTPTTVPTDEH